MRGARAQAIAFDMMRVSLLDLPALPSILPALQAMLALDADTGKLLWEERGVRLGNRSEVVPAPMTTRTAFAAPSGLKLKR